MHIFIIYNSNLLRESSKETNQEGDVVMSTSKNPAVIMHQGHNVHQNNQAPNNKQVSEKCVPYADTNVTVKQPGSRSPYLASTPSAHALEKHTKPESIQKKWPPPSPNALKS